MRSGIRFFGVLFVIMGLVSCGTNPLISPNKEMYWWSSTHSDAELLVKDIDISKCNKKYDKAGVMIFPFIRNQSWDDYFQNKDKNEFNNSLALSIMPYMTDAKQKHLIYPSREDKSTNKFNSYSVNCDNTEDINFYYRLPHYYPTVMFTTQNQQQQKQLHQMLQSKLKDFFPLTNIITLPSVGKKYKMGELLKIILKNEENTIKQQVAKFGLPFPIKVEFKGFGKGAASEIKLPYDNIIVDPQQKVSSPSPIPTPPAPTNPSSLNPDSSDSKNLDKTNNKITIKLPADFVNIFKSKNIKLTNHMKLIGCPKASFKQTRNSFVTENCSKKPSSLSIDGFILTKKQVKNGKTTTFEPNDIKTKEIIISSSEGNYFAYNGTTALSDCNISKGESSKSFPYTCIEKQLSFRVAQNLSRCNIKRTIVLKEILLSSAKDYPLHMSPFDCKVVITNWPASMMNKIPNICHKNIWGKKLTCKLSVADIRKAATNNGRKEFPLKLSAGWENTTISVDITNENSKIYSINVRPSWPFAHNYWWQWQHVRYNNRANPSCDKRTPKYAIKSVTYSNGNKRKPFNQQLQRKQLPTLQQIGWNSAKLPDTITLKLQQQGNPTAEKYHHNTEIKWKLSQVSGSRKWNFASKYKSKLEVKARQISLLTRSLNLSSRKSYGLYSFSSMDSCKNSSDGRSGRDVSYRDGQQTLTVKPCSKNSYFKFIDTLNGKPISRCAQPKSGQVSFQPYECLGKRKLIVVALSDKLDTHSNQIKKALTNAFQKNKKSFSLVTINPGRELSEELLQCEDIAGFNDYRNKNRFINKKLTKMGFGADDLDAWQNLEIVDLGYRSKLDKFAGIFYVTDDDKRSDFYKYLGLTQRWKNEFNIKLNVITTGSCQNWSTHAHASCQNINNIERALKNFLR
jgi:hypothetical protein